jgi:hypothetical protein
MSFLSEPFKHDLLVSYSHGESPAVRDTCDGLGSNNDLPWERG